LPTSIFGIIRIISGCWGDDMRAMDLFCGAGGSSLGAAAAGVDIVAGFDVWSVAGSVYRANFPRAWLYLCDLASLDESDIRGIHGDLGDVDLILASPPCVDHSPARGARLPSPAGLDLPWCVWRFAAVFLPRWIVVENVIGMRRWHDYRPFLCALMGLGYCVRVLVLDAADFGVSQRRRRLYIVCDRETDPPEIAPRTPHTPVSDVIDLDGYAYAPLCMPRRARATIERVERAICALGRDVPFISVYYGSGSQWQTLDVPLRTVTTSGHFALVRPDRRGGHEMRMLQVDELRRAMGFPASFDFCGCTRTDTMRLLGNAVCPPVMQAIVETLIGA
jgi:DNA (cytosine-5)-methyltransferase 1